MLVDRASIQDHASLNHVLGDDHVTIKSVLLVYNILVLICGVIGNSLVLLGSVRYGAIRMEINSVIMLENIAAADILATILQFIPMLVTLVTERWVMGHFICYSSIFRYIPFCCEAMLIAIMSCHRLWLLAFPLKLSMDTLWLKVVVAGLWVFYTITILIVATLWGGPVIRYEPSHLNCSPFDWQNLETVSAYQTFLRTLSGIYLFLPVIVTIVANIIILKLVYTSPTITVSGRNRSLKAALTISVICWMYVLSYLPSVVLFALPVAGVSNIPPYVNVINMYSLSLNLISNPFIYSYSNARFALFLKSLLTCNLRKYYLERGVSTRSLAGSHRNQSRRQTTSQ